jgi:pimeloyl-ACP methyl ester carboxylesterase
MSVTVRVVALAAVLVLAVLVLAGPVASRTVALVTVAEGLGFDPPRPFAPEVTREVVDLGGVEADAYLPQGADLQDQPAIVLVPGATPDGREDRRVVDIATAFARAGRTVVVPELEVYGEDLVAEDVDRLVQVAAALAADGEPVVLAGLSFGGSLSLLAAGDPRSAGTIGLVATFGAYADLAGVIQAATTGTSVVDGERFDWAPDPRAREVVEDQLLDLLPEQAARQVRQALEGGVDPASLPAELGAIHELLTTDDPDRVMALLDGAPTPVQDRIVEVSPVRAVPDLPVPLVALHAVDDPVIPYGELRRLELAYPDTDAISLATFDHVGPGADESWWVATRDLWRTARFVDRVLDGA